MKISNLTQIKTEYFEKSIVKTGRKKSIGSEFLILCPEIRKKRQLFILNKSEVLMASSTLCFRFLHIPLRAGVTF